jgi:integrase
MTFKIALSNWLAFQSAGKKPVTQKYHREIFAIVLNRWPNHEQLVADISETDVASFLPLVAHYSAPRFNATISALKKTLPLAGKSLRLRSVRVKSRAMVNQLQFSNLILELDSRPRSHAALIVNFLAHTGLRIKEANLLRWSDVGVEGIFLPAEFSKSGKPRFIPFVNGIGDVLARLRAINDGLKVIPHASIKTSLARACRVTGTPHLSHHDFRHLFATRCIESGVDLPTAARWLGHQDGGALLGKVYFHLADEHSRTMATRVKI